MAGIRSVSSGGKRVFSPRGRPSCGTRRRVFLQLRFAMAGALLATALTGCGPAHTRLTGMVTLDGKPVEGATLQFYPAAGDGQTSHAVTDATGTFLVKVSPVQLVVTISKAGATGEKTRAFPDSPLVDVIGESLSPRYSDRKGTELRVTPVAGTTTVADFRLSSDAR